MDFAIFRRKFDEILPKGKKIPEFHRNDQEMTKCLEILTKMAEKFGKCQKFPELVINFILHFIFSIHSLVHSQLQSQRLIVPEARSLTAC